MNWKNAYLETRVLSADPLELINILYEYSMLGVQDARSCLRHGDIAGRSKAISKVIAILGELESSLNYQLGGSIAINLAKLYQYMREKLTQANLSQADEPLAEVELLLKTLEDGWQQIGRKSGLASNDFRPENIMTGLGAFPLAESIPDHSSQSWVA